MLEIGRMEEGYEKEKERLIVSKTILNNAQKGSRKMDSELVSKYFGTPLFND